MIRTYDMFIPQGTTYTLSITFVGRDLTGYTARAHGRTSYDAASATWSWLTENGYLSISAGTDSVLTVSVSAAQSAAMTAGEGVYDIELVSHGGVVDRPVQGTYIVDPEVTR